MMLRMSFGLSPPTSCSTTILHFFPLQTVPYSVTGIYFLSQSGNNSTYSSILPNLPMSVSNNSSTYNPFAPVDATRTSPSYAVRPLLPNIVIHASFNSAMGTLNIAYPPTVYISRSYMALWTDFKLIAALKTPSSSLLQEIRCIYYLTGVTFISVSSMLALLHPVLTTLIYC